VTYRKFSAGPDQLTDIVNNAMELGPFRWSGTPLGGKTLIFSDPTATVTFPGAADALVTVPQLIAAIREQLPDMHIDVRDSTNGPQTPGLLERYISLYRDGGFTLSKDGTANSLFRLKTDAETKNKAPFPASGVKSVSRISPAEYEVVLSGPDADFDNPNADGTSQGA